MSYEDSTKTFSGIIETVPEKQTAFTISKELDEIEGHKIKIINENILTEEKDFKRSHLFTNLETFLKYVGQYKTNDTVLYYDKKKGLCWCVINEKSLKGGAELVNCVVSADGLLRANRSLTSISRGDDFLEFLKENKRNVENFRELYFIMSAIRISTKVEKTDIKGKNAEYNYTIKTEVMGVEKGEPVDLPDAINYVYRDYSMSFDDPVLYRFEADLYYSADRDGNLFIEVKVSNLEELENKQDKAFYDFIKDNAPDGVLVTIGSPDFRGIVRD